MSCGCSSTRTCSSCSSCSDNCPTCSAVCTSLEVANAWNVPICSGSAVLSFPGLTTVLIGAYLYNPTYGQFRITAFNSTNGEVTVTNDCFPDNAPAGTVVPALTTFIFAAVPTLISADGWVAADETWTYASATTITVPAGALTKYNKGMKIGLTQSASDKFFSIIDVADTLLTITGGSDYTLTNNTITEPRYSSADSPVGFPSYFNWSPTLGGFSVNPTGTLYQFYIDGGGRCHVDAAQAVAGTSNATTFTISAPVTAKTITNGFWAVVLTQATDNSADITAVPTGAYIPSGGTDIILTTTTAAGVWTNVGGKRANFTNLVYPI